MVTDRNVKAVACVDLIEVTIWIKINRNAFF